MKINATANTDLYNATKKQRQHIKTMKRLKNRKAAQNSESFAAVLDSAIKHNENQIKGRIL